MAAVQATATSDHPGTLASDRPQRDLFKYNIRFDHTPAEVQHLREIETPWVDGLLARVAEDGGEKVDTFEKFRERMNGIIEEEAQNPPPSCLFLANEADDKAFRFIVEQFAVDALTEAKSFLPILGHLPVTAQMPVLRVLIDEFGCGNLSQMHTYLYMKLLDELGMSTELDDYFDITVEEVFAFSNIFHWTTKRAPCPEYFLGGLAWFEAVVPTFFSHYVKACERLGIANHHYFSEHVHIDPYHAHSVLKAIQETARHRDLDYERVWHGTSLLATVTADAFDKVVDVWTKGEKV
ncbi:iron-containing redox enzyme family protein [Ferruginivarius sediminum]|uniref:Iron-containing redox enzyme family protein n=1 Tax=Ferruginivarius sediminum TaxID=2661937 RepID=A0A369TC37_9PROT|nr:iron-containing redox enzyme family protein [Ferruginivarius sediminum]RDD62084.1 iron-containing redox enzyme family protein [Ferruginivarius sediminum]